MRAVAVVLGALGVGPSAIAQEDPSLPTADVLAQAMLLVDRQTQYTFTAAAVRAPNAVSVLYSC